MSIKRPSSELTSNCTGTEDRDRLWLFLRRSLAQHTEVPKHSAWNTRERERLNPTPLPGPPVLLYFLSTSIMTQVHFRAQRVTLQLYLDTVSSQLTENRALDEEHPAQINNPPRKNTDTFLKNVFSHAFLFLRAQVKSVKWTLSSCR